MNPTARTTPGPAILNCIMGKALPVPSARRSVAETARPTKSAKRIEFFRREDGARTSGVGVDAGGKTSLNYGGQRRLGDLA